MQDLFGEKIKITNTWVSIDPISFLNDASGLYRDDCNDWVVAVVTEH